MAKASARSPARERASGTARGSGSSRRPARLVASVALGGRDIPLILRTSPRARRVTLRIDPAEDAVELVLPRGVSAREGLKFAAEKSGWILTRLAARPPRVPFAPGAVLPLLGIDHVVRHRPEARGVVWREEGAVCVAGRAEHLPRRLGDWLKREARREIAARAAVKAALIGRRVRRIGLRDPKTRWGSCAPSGVLSFSWRLVLAPEAVLDYVVAHEVAHLVEANHGPRFWRLVARLTAEVEAPRDWLRRYGYRLLRYG
jgi:predicted metal-dependent hydrolase